MFHKNSGIEKVYGNRGGEDRGSITIFRQKFLVSVPKNFVGEPFSVSLKSGNEKSYA